MNEIIVKINCPRFRGTPVKSCQPSLLHGIHLTSHWRNRLYHSWKIKKNRKIDFNRFYLHHFFRISLIFVLWEREHTWNVTECHQTGNKKSHSLTQENKQTRRINSSVSGLYKTQEMLLMILNNSYLTAGHSHENREHLKWQSFILYDLFSTESDPDTQGQETMLHLVAVLSFSAPGQ